MQISTLENDWSRWSPSRVALFRQFLIGLYIIYVQTAFSLNNWHLQVQTDKTDTSDETKKMQLLKALGKPKMRDKYLI